MGKRTPFTRVDRGVYALRRGLQQQSAHAVANEIIEDEKLAEASVINAFGMFWERPKVLWEPSPHLYGQQQAKSRRVDFGQQIGVYLLHDTPGVVYVGRVTEQSTGKRLYQHTVDRFNGRWNRFFVVWYLPHRERRNFEN